MAVPTEKQLNKINKFSKVELSDDAVEVFENLMIDTLPVRSHGIIISEQLMDKFLQDANKGIPQMMVHNTKLLPVGKVFEAQTDDELLADGNLIRTLYGSFYIPKDMPVSGFPELTTDSLIDMINKGLLTDTSIGFSAPKLTCNICGFDIREWWKCEHVPTRDYAVDDNIKTCWAIAEGEGSLNENSLVYSGACERASILSKDTNYLQEQIPICMHLVDDLKCVPLDANVTFHFSKTLGLSVFSDKQLTKKEELPMSKILKTADISHNQKKDLELIKADDSKETANNKLSEVQNSDITSSYEELKVNPEEVVEELKTENEKLKAELSKAKNTISELKKFEGIANGYREDLVKQILELGVKAQGNAFNQDRYSKYLKTLSIDELTEEIVSFKAEIAERFGNSESRITSSETHKKDSISVEYGDMDENEKREFLTDEAKKLMETEDGKKKSFREAFSLMRKKFEKLSKEGAA